MAIITENIKDSELFEKFGKITLKNVISFGEKDPDFSYAKEYVSVNSCYIKKLSGSDFLFTQSDIPKYKLWDIDCCLINTPSWRISETIKESMEDTSSFAFKDSYVLEFLKFFQVVEITGDLPDKFGTFFVKRDQPLSSVTSLKPELIKVTKNVKEVINRIQNSARMPFLTEVKQLIREGVEDLVEIDLDKILNNRDKEILSLPPLVKPKPEIAASILAGGADFSKELILDGEKILLKSVMVPVVRNSIDIVNGVEEETIISYYAQQMGVYNISRRELTILHND